MLRRALLALLFAGSGVAWAQDGSAADLARLVAWFGGEWNNHEQVWQQKIDAADPKVTVKEDPSPHLHHVFAPVSVPALGGAVFYVQQARADALDKPHRQRLYRFSTDDVERAIKLEIFRLRDEPAWLDAHRQPSRLAALTLAELQPTPGCEVWWRFDAQRQLYSAATRSGACRITSREGRPLRVQEQLELTPDELRILDRIEDDSGQLVVGSKTGTPTKNRKVRYFDGWIWIKHAGPQAAPDDRRASFTRNVRIHNAGTFLPIRHEDGSESPYLLELAQLTYQNTRTAILKIGIVDKATRKSLAYAWASTDSARVGINLGWLQAGFTLKAQQPEFGF